jgi:hypothetical protein
MTTIHQFRCRFNLIAVLGCAIVMLMLERDVSAVIIAGGDGTANTSAPSDDPGWANVGSLNGASCVYLGDGWVLTASHVGIGSVSLGTSSYGAIQSTYTRLYQPGSPSQLVDLAMFRLQTVPVGLAAVTVSTTEPAGGSSIVAIGNGLDRAPTATWWDSSWNAVSATDPTATFEGYSYASTQSKRWGTNLLRRQTSISDGFGTTDVWYSSFSSNGSGNEMQAAPGDSGGAMFYKDGDSWELAGIILAIDSPASEHKPDSLNAAVFNDLTYYADLGHYSSEIAQVIATDVPEPSTFVLLSAGALALIGYGCRRARHGRSDRAAVNRDS